MSRHRVPIIQCDGNDGFCGITADDLYEQGASSANGTRITATTRFPGWHSTDDEDHCPEHIPTREDQTND